MRRSSGIQEIGRDSRGLELVFLIESAPLPASPRSVFQPLVTLSTSSLHTEPLQSVSRSPPIASGGGKVGRRPATDRPCRPSQKLSRYGTAVFPGRLLLLTAPYATSFILGGASHALLSTTQRADLNGRRQLCPGLFSRLLLVETLFPRHRHCEATPHGLALRSEGKPSAGLGNQGKRVGS